MAQSVWHRDDIRNALLSVDGSNRDIAQHIDTPEMRLYRRGFEAALAAIAAALGLSWQAPPLTREVTNAKAEI